MADRPRTSRPPGRSQAGRDGTVSSTSAERFARRARWRRAGAVRALLVLVALAGLVGGSTWVVLFSDLLVVEQVRVVGTSRVPVSEVRRAAGVGRGTPLGRVDVGEVDRRVSRIPPVADVDVRRVLPDTLRLSVTERRPVVAVPDTSGFQLVDSEGVAFDAVAVRPRGVPLLRTDVASRSRPATLRAALRVLSDVPATVSPRVRQVSARTVDHVVLRLAGGARVVWGSPEAGARKARVLAALVRRPARVYDVSAPDAPAIRR